MSIGKWGENVESSFQQFVASIDDLLPPECFATIYLAAALSRQLS